MTRVANIILALLIVAGAVYLIRNRQTLSDVRAQRDGLAIKYGVLDVKDPTKYCVTRIDTGDPAHFLWRVYYPAQLTVSVRNRFASSGNGYSSSTDSAAGDSLVRIHFDLEAQRLTLHSLGRAGGSMRRINNHECGEFMKTHWNELVFDVLASDKTVEMTTDQVMTFLVIGIPDHLLELFKQQVGEEYAEKVADGRLCEIAVGTPEAFETIEANARLLDAVYGPANVFAPTETKSAEDVE